MNRGMGSPPARTRAGVEPETKPGGRAPRSALRCVALHWPPGSPMQCSPRLHRHPRTARGRTGGGSRHVRGDPACTWRLTRPRGPPARTHVAGGIPRPSSPRFIGRVVVNVGAGAVENWNILAPCVAVMLPENWGLSKGRLQVLDFVTFYCLSLPC